MKILPLAFCGLLFASSAAMAEIGGGVAVGTWGLGGDVSYRLAGPLDLRLGYGGYNYSRSLSESGIDYDAKLKISGVRALADLNLPLGFRATGGLVFNNNRVNVTGKPSGGTYTINNTTYNASDVASLSGRVKLGKSVVPYLGVGWGRVSGFGVGFYADVGAMYLGKSTTTLNVSCGSALSGAQCSQLQSDAAAEQSQFEDSLHKYRWYPVLSIGISVGF